MKFCAHVFLALLLTTAPLISQTIDEYFITCDADEFRRMYENPRDEILVPVTFTFKGETWVDVMMRVRGDTSRDLPKKSLKFLFETPFANGRDALNFNAEYLDKSYIHSFMSSYVMRAAGHPCFTADYARLYINGEFRGLYALIENVDEMFLESWDFDPDGNLYKATKDNSCLSIFDDVYTLWEKKTNRSSGREDLQLLIDQLATVPDDRFYDFARTEFDYDRLVNILALNILTANGSTYYHNYYMYHDIHNTNTWTMLPWDLDKTFRSQYGAGHFHTRSSGAHNPDNPLVERMFIDPQAYSDIQERTRELAETLFNTPTLGPIVDSLSALLESSVREDPFDDVDDVAEWLDILDDERWFIEHRFAIVRRQFAEFPRPFRVERITRSFRENLKFIWHPSFDPLDNDVSYTFSYSTDLLFPDDNSVTFENLKDTTFTLQETPPEGRYFWRVHAVNSFTKVQGFDKYNIFEIRRGTDLPERIEGAVTLDIDGSPYYSNGDLVIPEGQSLTVEPGVELRMAANARILVFGELHVQGSEHNPAIIQPREGADRWGALYFESTSVPSTIRHAVIDLPGGPDLHDAAVVITSSDVTIEHVRFLRNSSSVAAQGGVIVIRHCVFDSTNLAEQLGIRNAIATVEYCDFLANDSRGDAIDFDFVSNVVIRGNRIYSSTDDGIDIGSGSENCIISDNLIMNCSDKAISLGESSSAQMSGNIIVGSGIAISIKDKASAVVDRTTLYNNDVGFEVVENIQDFGGGNARISNTIIVGSQTADIVTDEQSTVVIEYSISDARELEGAGNLSAAPLLSDPDAGNFRLLPESPCIDAGDPDAIADPDGTRADIGALYFHQSEAGDIVINEINYHSADERDTKDWVELYNPNDFAIDISGWTFKDQDDGNAYDFPENAAIEAMDYLILCRNSSAFLVHNPEVRNVYGDLEFKLSNEGELIRLFDAGGTLVDSLSYGVQAPWPSEPDGSGVTLELIAPDLDNAVAANWNASQRSGGSPGEPNGRTTDTGSDSRPRIHVEFNTRPNPLEDFAYIELNVSEPSVLHIDIFDMFGSNIASLATNKNIQRGTTRLSLNAAAWPIGMYMYKVHVSSKGFSSFIKTYPMVIMR